MIYILWSVTMLIPAYFILRSERTFDRRPVAAFYGLLIGLTGAGGQLVLFKALTIGPAYLIFPRIGGLSACSQRRPRLILIAGS
jgi:hypothetical protein